MCLYTEAYRGMKTHQNVTILEADTENCVITNFGVELRNELDMFPHIQVHKTRPLFLLSKIINTKYTN